MDALLPTSHTHQSQARPPRLRLPNLQRLAVNVHLHGLCLPSLQNHFQGPQAMQLFTYVKTEPTIQLASCWIQKWKVGIHSNNKHHLVAHYHLQLLLIERQPQSAIRTWICVEPHANPKRFVRLVSIQPHLLTPKAIYFNNKCTFCSLTVNS